MTAINPVVTAMPIGTGLSPGFGFNRPGVLVFYPLAHDACFVAGSVGPAHREIDCQSVARINDLVIKLARRHVYSREQDGAIDGAVQRYGGIAKHGENVFVPSQGRLEQWKLACRQVLRSEFGLHAPLVLALEARPDTRTR